MGRAEQPLIFGAGKLGRVLITGAKGSVGQALMKQLLADRHTNVVTTDLRDLDVTNEAQVERHLKMWKPEVIFHLAGAKHAPNGEDDPLGVTMVNTIGTANVLRHAPEGSRVVVASTCKACNPETAYGASKLIAERMTLNAGHSVARFYNVVESADNVFAGWHSLDAEAPIPWTACTRFFISMSEAVSLLLRVATTTPGRYTLDPGLSRSMHTVARVLYPERELVEAVARRGDRLQEPLRAEHELIMQDNRLWRVSSPHDGKEEG